MSRCWTAIHQNPPGLELTTDGHGDGAAVKDAADARLGAGDQAEAGGRAW